MTAAADWWEDEWWWRAEVESAWEPKTCPNCGKRNAELFGNEDGVIHCGCYYEAGPSEVLYSVVGGGRNQ
jgi:hypothetical protein